MCCHLPGDPREVYLDMRPELQLRKPSGEKPESRIKDQTKPIELANDLIAEFAIEQRQR